MNNLSGLRALMTASSWDAVIIPCSDPHLSEYIPERWKSLQWISGFTGSAGVAVVSRVFAGLWTDSRYFLQAEDQLKTTGFELVKLKTANSPEYIEFLRSHLPAGSTVAVAEDTMAANLFFKIQKELGENGIRLVPVPDFWDALWKSRPGMPAEKITEHPLSCSGKSRVEKIAAIRASMAENKCTTHVITTLDDIAWTLNLRGSDIRYNPVFLAYLVINTKHVFLFTDLDRLPEPLKRTLSMEGIGIAGYDQIIPFLSELTHGSRCMLDGRKVNVALYNAVCKKSTVLDTICPAIRLKAVKNETEIRNLKQTQEKDGVSLVKFFCWLENAIGKEKITEGKIADKLFEFRSMHSSFRGCSFSSIVGYKEHAALPHYTPVPATDKEIESEGILLLDTGGQYEGGTTDITRTISLGKIKEEEKKDYTAVLKGFIALITARFPQHTTALSLDTLARRPVWDAGRNYLHGTGHGVGFFLNVHEGPQAFGINMNSIPDTVMMEGMVSTIEPGIYHKGKYGIRIENMILTVADEQIGDIFFLRFESLSLCPISTDLIETTMLSEQEKAWLNRYHQEVYERLSPYLDGEEKQWLKDKTIAIDMHPQHKTAVLEC